MNQRTNLQEWILRLGIFGTFIGHGSIALSTKASWIPLITSFGFSRDTAITLMPLIGIMDIAVAFVALFWPIRIILIWAIIWAFAAAFSRIVAGEPIWEFVERLAEWIVPMALLSMHGFPKKLRDLFTIW